MVTLALAAAPAQATTLTIGTSTPFTFTETDLQFSFQVEIAPADGTGYLYFTADQLEIYSVSFSGPSGSLYYLTPPAGLSFGPGLFQVEVTWTSLLVEQEITFALLGQPQPDIPLLNATETPLPATLPLMGSLVLMGLLAARRRRGALSTASKAG